MALMLSFAASGSPFAQLFRDSSGALSCSGNRAASDYALISGTACQSCRGAILRHSGGFSGSCTDDSAQRPRQTCPDCQSL